MTGDPRNAGERELLELTARLERLVAEHEASLPPFAFANAVKALACLRQIVRGYEEPTPPGARNPTTGKIS